MLYKAKNKQGQTATIEAASFTRDGSGTVFYDDNGGQVAAFGDGVIVSVVPANIEFGNEPEVIEE